VLGSSDRVKVDLNCAVEAVWRIQDGEGVFVQSNGVADDKASGRAQPAVNSHLMTASTPDPQTVTRLSYERVLAGDSRAGQLNGVAGCAAAPDSFATTCLSRTCTPSPIHECRKDMYDKCSERSDGQGNMQIQPHLEPALQLNVPTHSSEHGLPAR
jgi:hypothetical protein